MFSIGATIGKIFGTEKAITAVIKNVSNGLDALVYTDEEKASLFNFYGRALKRSGDLIQAKKKYLIFLLHRFCFFFECEQNLNFFFNSFDVNGKLVV